MGNILNNKTKPIHVNEMERDVNRRVLIQKKISTMCNKCKNHGYILDMRNPVKIKCRKAQCRNVWTVDFPTEGYD